MTDPVYILTFDQWSALTSAAGHLKGTGEGLLSDSQMSHAAHGCIAKADEAFAAVAAVRPTWLARVPA